MYVNYSFMHQFFQVIAETEEEKEHLRKIAANWTGYLSMYLSDSGDYKLQFFPASVQKEARKLFDTALKHAAETKGVES